MNVTVRLFAIAKDLAGTGFVELKLDADATIRDLRSALISALPSLSDIADHMLFSMNSQYAPDHTPVIPDADIGCIPPVSGG